MKKILKTSLYIATFALAGILFQVSCSNTNNSASSTAGKILYVKGSGNIAQSIWMCNLDGSNQTLVPIELPTGQLLYFYAAGNEHSTLKFSPDGQKIIFTTSSIPGPGTIDANYIYSCNLDGGNVQQLVSTETEVNANAIFIGDIN